MRAILAIAFVMIAGAADAQDQPPATPAPIPTQDNSAQFFQAQARQVEGVRRVNQRTRFSMDDQLLRLDRAERLSALANSGHCEEAVGFALQEGDRAMARQLTRICDL